MDKGTIRSKFLGSLIGTGVGDALGAGLEGHRTVDEAVVRTLAEKSVPLVYTDDTHMMIGVAESLIARKGFDGEHMTRRFMENYDREPWRGYGPGPPRVFRWIQAGAAWDEAAGKLYGGGSFGNGSAMRVAPVGLLYYDELPKLRQIAYESSRITHTHDLGKEGAALQAYAVALATSADPSSQLRIDEFLAELFEFLREPVFQQKVQRIGELLGQADKRQVIQVLGHGIEAFNSVPAAIYSFLSYPNSFEDAVIYAISLGGDTDTIAAMTGAISGAYLGIEAIPGKWRERLENGEYLTQLAEELWHIRVRPDSTGQSRYA
ncbi:MAG: ADP-ribosylglycohydrolase family protein [Chloroflexi bacterium]|nr:ADP-ribosylglycohydrolase family protein [Chloroflexota bacterium]